MQAAISLSRDSIDLFHKSLQDRGRAISTAKAYSADLLTFLTRTERISLCREDYEQAAMEYLNARRHEAAASTVRRLASFRQFARWAWEKPVLMDYKTPQSAEPTPHPIAEGMAGIRAMLNACVNDNQRALVGLQGFFALRVSEARAVRAINFNESEQQLQVRGKGSKDRELDYDTANIVSILTPYQRSLFDGLPLCLLSDSGARAAIKTVAERAGITGDVSSHDLRATCLTALYDASGDIEMVRRFAGHANVKQTQVYIGSRRIALRAAVAFA